MSEIEVACKDLGIAYYLEICGTADILRINWFYTSGDEAEKWKRDLGEHYVTCPVCRKVLDKKPWQKEE